MSKTLLKNIAIYIGLVLAMLVAAYAFVPQVLSGKVVNQSDITGWRGMAQESIAWNNAHPDDKTAWSDTMFGGMPNVTFLDDFEGDWTKPLYKALLWGTRPASYLFIAMLGAFLMMLAMGVNRYLSLLGAFAVAFCSYNMQIIQVGHNTKMQAIAFAPFAIAALIFTYRQAFLDKKKWLPLTILGSVLFALALSMQIKANHIQITYYLAIIIFIYAIATAVWVLRKENRPKLKRFLISSALLLAVGLVGIATNTNKLLPTYNYTPYTMRGGSELTSEGANSKGLSLDYATAWSYGIEETPNLMIPNYNGGSSSGSLGEDSQTYKLFKRGGANAKQICRSLPLYWGPQPFTAGPMYIGAICIFLFILGMLLLKGREKWWLFASCILAILLAWGSHFMWFTELWFKYAPFYNKFRTVSMALVILQFCVPLLGIYTLNQIFKEKFDTAVLTKAVLVSAGITAGFCALAALFPSIAGDFISPFDAQMQDSIVEALAADRRHLLRVDAVRSMMLILISAAIIIWTFRNKEPFVVRGRAYTAAATIAVLLVFDLWSVGKRYLNSEHFVTPRDFSACFNERQVDKFISQDKDLSYRVLDLSENTFNSSVTSFRHKSIGGYSPTKMQRYQDIIDNYLTPEINSFYRAAGNAGTLEQIQNALPYMPVTSMLNGRYVIIGADYPPVVNLNAFGPVWTVGKCVEAATADEEIALLGAVDLHNEAVVRTEDIPALCSGDADAYIEMTSYAPNELRYEYSSDKDVIAVFSEVYHPDWKAAVNGSELKLFRANWILRAAVLPAGEGEIVMSYHPEDYTVSSRISTVCSLLLLILLAVSVAFLTVKSKKTTDA